MKNEAATREVPVHSRLQALGLIDLLSEQKRKGETMLFSDMERGGADGRYGHNFTKWFTRYRKKVAVYRPLLDFHSLRHTATTAMKRKNVSQEIVDALTGHTTPGETPRYTHGFEMSQLAAAIETIQPPLKLAATVVG